MDALHGVVRRSTWHLWCLACMLVLAVVFIIIDQNRTGGLTTFRAASVTCRHDNGNGEGESVPTPVSPIVCPMQQGRWVYNATREKLFCNTCPFVDLRRNCFGNGDRRQHAAWEWIPDDGSVLMPPTSEDFAHCLRNKRVAFVGDSITRNQFASLACILYNGHPSSVRKTEKGQNIYLYFIPDNITLHFFRSNFLLHTDYKQGGTHRVVDPNRVDEVWADHIHTFDVVLIGAFNWWLVGNTTIKGEPKRKWDNKEMFQRMLDLVVPYLDARMKGRPVVWRARSPIHSGTEGDWRSANCTYYDRPLTTLSPALATIHAPYNGALLRSLANSTSAFLDITWISQYRHDGHPGVFSPKRQGVQDCSHWCVPGVPDVWNQLLLSMLCNGDETLFSCKPQLP